MSSRLPPSGSLCTSLTSLHYPLLCLWFKCQDIRLPQAVSPALPPEQRGVRLEECTWKQLAELESDEQRIGLRRCQLKAFFFVRDLENLVLPFNVSCYSRRIRFSLMLLKIRENKHVPCRFTAAFIIQMFTVSVVFTYSSMMHPWVHMCWMRPTITQDGF